MALFEKSLNALATLNSVLTTANETFRAERKKLLETLKEPTKQIGEMRNALTETEAEQKRIFTELVKENFASVRGKIQTVVTAAPPSEFAGTLEAIRAAGKSITDIEASMYLEKYKGNYLAFRTLHEVLTQAGKNLETHLIYPDALLEEMSQGEQMIIRTGRDSAGTGTSSYMMALLQSDKNPIVSLSEKVEAFLDGRYSLENEEE